MSSSVQEQIEDLEATYCEMHKDVYGVKARWIKFATVEEGRKALDRLSEELKVEMDSQAAAQQLAIAAFEEFAKTCPDREAAIRWQHQAYDTDGDDDYLCYRLGLPYGYFKGASNA